MNDLNRISPDQPATADEVAAEQPQRIGRSHRERVLGKGGFGLVYLPPTGSCNGPSLSRCRTAAAASSWRSVSYPLVYRGSESELKPRDKERDIGGSLRNESCRPCE
jgi:hypothetical protein